MREYFETAVDEIANEAEEAISQESVSEGEYAEGLEFAISLLQNALNAERESIAAGSDFDGGY